MNLLFGTDGVRGRVGLELNEAHIRELGLAAASHLKAKRVFIGRDTRESSLSFAMALKEGFSLGGIEAISLGVAPTPEVAHVAKVEHAAGAVISASHNIWSDNGVKLFAIGGLKISDSIQDAIQKDWGKQLVKGSFNGNDNFQDTLDTRWVDFVVASTKSNFFKGIRVVLDCANGATTGKASSIFNRLGAEVIEIGSEPDGRNINEASGSTDPRSLIEKVLSTSADVGFAFDGDGDRVMAVDVDGNLLDGDYLLGICALDRLNKKSLTASSVVVTPMANLGLRKSFLELGISIDEVEVGDRNVLEALDKKNWVLGGEQSGHIVLGDYSTTGDGLIAALQVLAILVLRSGPASKVCRLFESAPQILKNVRISSGQIIDTVEVRDAIREAELLLEKRGRLLIRKSGTEEVVRVMVEGNDNILINSVGERVAKAIERSGG